MESFETTPSIEAKSEAVKKCAKTMFKCLKICKRKKSLKKTSEKDNKSPKK